MSTLRRLNAASAIRARGMSAPRPVTRLVSLVTSVAIVGAGFLALNHQVEERHEICAEHGEQIHLSTDADGTPTPESAVTKGPEDHHEHCGVAWTAPETPDDRAQSSTSDQVLAAVDTLRGQRWETPRSLYRLAPKNSPPV